MTKSRAVLVSCLLGAVVTLGCGGKGTDTGTPPAAAGGTTAATGPNLASTPLPTARSGTEQPPFRLVAGEANITVLASDGVELFWGAILSDSKTEVMRRCELNNCDGTLQTWTIGTQLSSSRVPYEITIADTRIYWRGSNSVYACLRSDCSSVQQLASGDIRGMALDGDQLVFQATGPVLARCQVKDCPSTTERIELALPVSASPLYLTGPMWLDANYYYLTGNGRVYRLSKGGSAPAELVLEQPSATLVAMTGDSLILRRWSDKTVIASPKSGASGDPRVLWTGLSDSAGRDLLIVDEQFLYAYQCDQGCTLSRCPLAGCIRPEVLASLSDGLPVGLYQDARYLYVVGMKSSPFDPFDPTTSDDPTPYYVDVVSK